MYTLAVLTVYAIFVVDMGYSSSQNGLPTKAEITKVMDTVQELFDGVKITFIEELDATDESVPIEAEKLAERAKETLDLIEEMSILKLSCLVSENTLCTSNSKTKIQKVVAEGDRFLDMCISQAAGDVRNSSSRFMADTNKAASKGHAILESLDDCMQRTGFQQFSCYRKVVNSDVEPLKEALMETIRKHKDNHIHMIKIRSDTFQCIENVLATYKKKIAEVLTESLNC